MGRGGERGDGTKTTKARRGRDLPDISRKYPTYRTQVPITVEGWLAGKQQDDDAEGLWRIHDTLYDFTDFVRAHPGGEFWLRETRGCDITEHFEAHHISVGPANMLKKFAVRAASGPRNVTLTFAPNGFYRTLKGRVRQRLATVEQSAARQRSNFYHLLLLTATFAFAMLYAGSDGSLWPLAFASLALCWLTICAHNYFHQRDNWQMYTFNLSLLNFSEWRVSHALSHHAFPNSLQDLELALFEPLLCWVPSERYATRLLRVVSILGQPVVYALLFQVSLLKRVVSSLLVRNILHWHDVIGFSLPLAMWCVSPATTSVTTLLWRWNVLLSTASILFAIISVNGAHHDPKIYHPGDAFRADRDWGLFQLDTIIDWRELKSSDFLVLTNFGEHALHHLFPTLDHGVLPQLYPALRETLREFGSELRECNHLEQIVGQHRQLWRTTANPIPPGGDRVTKTVKGQ